MRSPASPARAGGPTTVLIRLRARQVHCRHLHATALTLCLRILSMFLHALCKLTALVCCQKDYPHAGTRVLCPRSIPARCGLIWLCKDVSGRKKYLVAQQQLKGVLDCLRQVPLRLWRHVLQMQSNKTLGVQRHHICRPQQIAHFVYAHIQVGQPQERTAQCKPFLEAFERSFSHLPSEARGHELQPGLAQLPVGAVQAAHNVLFQHARSGRPRPSPSRPAAAPAAAGPAGSPPACCLFRHSQDLLLMAETAQPSSRNDIGMPSPLKSYSAS